MRDMACQVGTRTSSTTRPALISVQLHRPSKDYAFGIGLCFADGVPKIKSICPNGLISQTPIRTGDRLIHLGNAPPLKGNGSSAKELAQYFNGVFTQSGHITIAVENRYGDAALAEAVVFKDSPSSCVGICIANNRQSGLLQISRINPTGLLGPDSVLEVGDYVEQINYRDVATMDVNTVESMILSIVGFTSIRVRRALSGRNNATKGVQLSHDMMKDINLEGGITTLAAPVGNLGNTKVPPEQAPPPFSELRGGRPEQICVQLRKQGDNPSMGVRLCMTDTGFPAVVSIVPTGMFAQTPIQEGDVLIRVGNAPPSVLRSASKLAEYIGTMFNSSGSVTVVVETNNGEPGTAEAVVFKDDATSDVGLYFDTNTRSGQLQICRIDTAGLLGSNNVLQVGDCIEQINSHDVSILGEKGAKGMLKSIVGYTSIRVRHSASEE